MITEIIRSLYQYNLWANTRILTAAANLSPQQLKEPRGASFASIHNTLVHIMSVQWIWLSRWKGISPRVMLDHRDCSSESRSGFHQMYIGKTRSN